MTQSGATTTWTYDMSTFADYANAAKVVFSDSTDNTKTIETDLPGIDGKKGWACTFTSKKTNYIYVVGISPFNQNMTAFWSDINTDTNDSYMNSCVNTNLGNMENNVGTGNYSAYYAIVPDNAASKRYLRVKTNGNPVKYAPSNSWLDISGHSGGGHVYRASDSGLDHLEALSSGNFGGSWSNQELTYPIVDNNISTVTVTYQPEDRYGYIANTSNTSDRTYGADTLSTINGTYTQGTETTTQGNFIKIVDNTSMSEPYIRFYSDTAGTAANIIGGVAKDINIKAAKLNGTAVQLGDGTAANPYLIRLPKNAMSAQLYDGDTAVGSLIVLDDDGGSTLTVTEENSTKTVTKTQTERTYANVTAPSFKTDHDYIYFTDVNSSFGNNVYAYWYGGADGEYSAWPGTAPAASYTDNSGKKVYAFRPPSYMNGDLENYPYPYVIFNNGSASDRKLTQAVNYETGKNYSVDSTGTDQHYGVKSDSNYRNASPVASVAKAAGTKATYNKYSPDKYIYIVNNGTASLLNGINDNDRYALDEMHITFYSDKNGTNVIGTDSPSYIADKLDYGYYAIGSESYPVYKISVPDNAVAFSINNGQGKGSGTENYYRQSVVEPLSINGLYKFVAGGTEQSDYIDNSSHYKLTLLNERQQGDEDEEEDDVATADLHLATIETGLDGMTSKITWLKPEAAEGKVYDPNDTTTHKPNSVDHEYLANEYSDIDAEGKTVRVVKWGTYYWKETKAPKGYKIDNEVLDDFIIGAAQADKTVNITKATDTRLHGAVTLTKTSEQKLGTADIGTKLEGAKFKLYDINDKNYLVLKNSTKNEYYVPEAVTGKSTVKYENGSSYFEVTDDAMLAELNDYELVENSVNKFKLYDIVTTGSDGKLSIKNIDWGRYYLSEVAQYKLYENTDTTNSTPILVIKNKTEDKYFIPTSVTVNTAENGSKYLEVTDNLFDGYELFGDDNNKHFKLYDTITTGEEGKPVILNITDTYHVVKDNVPAGYTETDSVTGKANKVHFSIGRNNSAESETQQLSCTNEIQYAKLKIKKKLDQYLEAWGTPTFIFKIKKIATEESNTTFERIISMQVTNATNMQGETEFIDIEPGIYEITELNVSRYSPKNAPAIVADESTNVTGVTPSDSKKVSFNVGADGIAVVQFENSLDYYDKYSHNDLKVNNFNGSKDIMVQYLDLVNVLDTDGKEKTVAIIPKTELTMYLIDSDGKGRKLDRATDAAILNSLEISYDGDDNTFKQKFIDDGPIIKISDPALFANGIYKLKAKYGELECTFDITFNGKKQDQREYEKTFIFRADNDNISYFNENGMTSQYEFTFTMVKDGDTYKVGTIRHNGKVVEVSDVKKIIGNSGNVKLNIIDTHTSEYRYENIWLDSAQHEISAANTANVDSFYNDILESTKNKDSDSVTEYTAKLTPPIKKTFTFKADDHSHFNETGEPKSYSFVYTAVKDKNTGTYSVTSIRHNGYTQNDSDVSAVISNSGSILVPDNGYTFSGWQQNGADITYDAIISQINSAAVATTGDTTIEYSVKLTS